MNRYILRHCIRVRVDMGMIEPRAVAVISNTGVVLKLELDHHPSANHPELIPGSDAPDELLEQVVALNNIPVLLLAHNVMVVGKGIFGTGNHEDTYQNEIEDILVRIAEKQRAYAVSPDDKTEKDLEFWREAYHHQWTAACRDFHLFRGDPDGVFGEKL